MGFLLLLMAVSFEGFGFVWDHPAASWWRRWPEQWVYPLQAVVCFALLLRWWKIYELRWDPAKIVLGVACGAVGIGIWLLPTTLYDHLGMTGEPEGWRRWLGLAPRTDGFNPWVLGDPAACWTSLVLRFFRAAVVVALVEEIFWRGFVMRFVLDWDGDYWKQPFGKH
jgi:membrane protease YdiL (CAAX protease family)